MLIAGAEPCGILSPRGRSCNGRHERVSQRICVIVDSNDMPVMRSHRVATEMVVSSQKKIPNYRICSRATLAGPARSGGRGGDEAQRPAQWLQRLEVMVEAPIRCCGTQGSTGRPGTAGRQLASRADQTTERGLWARAHRGSKWPPSRPSTAGELLLVMEARYQCRMQHGWSRGGCQAVRKSPSGSRRARLERRRPTWASTAL